MADKVLLVMDPEHRASAIGELRGCRVEFAEASDWRSARKILSTGTTFKAVIASVAVADATWCKILQELRGLGSKARLLVCADRHDQLLCGEVVARGGYYAVSPPHAWKLLRDAVDWALNARVADVAPGVRGQAARYAVA